MQSGGGPVDDARAVVVERLRARRDELVDTIFARVRGDAFGAAATIKLPILPAGQYLHGFVYLASPQNFMAPPLENPFGSLVAMYMIAKDPVSGILVKLPGSVAINEATGLASRTLAGVRLVPGASGSYLGLAARALGSGFVS
jgi:hypothetical protein